MIAIDKGRWELILWVNSTKLRGVTYYTEPSLTKERIIDGYLDKQKYDLG